MGPRRVSRPAACPPFPFSFVAALWRGASQQGLRDSRPLPQCKLVETRVPSCGDGCSYGGSPHGHPLRLRLLHPLPPVCELEQVGAFGRASVDVFVRALTSLFALPNISGLLSRTTARTIPFPSLLEQGPPPKIFFVR